MKHSLDSVDMYDFCFSFIFSSLLSFQLVSNSMWERGGGSGESGIFLYSGSHPLVVSTMIFFLLV